MTARHVALLVRQFRSWRAPADALASTLLAFQGSSDGAAVATTATAATAAGAAEQGSLPAVRSLRERLHVTLLRGLAFAQHGCGVAALHAELQASASAPNGLAAAPSLADPAAPALDSVRDLVPAQRSIDATVDERSAAVVAPPAEDAVAAALKANAACNAALDALVFEVQGALSTLSAYAPDALESAAQLLTASPRRDLALNAPDASTMWLLASLQVPAVLIPLRACEVRLPFWCNRLFRAHCLGEPTAPPDNQCRRSQAASGSAHLSLSELLDLNSAPEQGGGGGGGGWGEGSSGSPTVAAPPVAATGADDNVRAASHTVFALLHTPTLHDTCDELAATLFGALLRGESQFWIGTRWRPRGRTGAPLAMLTAGLVRYSVAHVPQCALLFLHPDTDEAPAPAPRRA